MADADRVIIAGAGIAGLTTALALGRIGLASTVLERRTALAESGAGIQLSPNASGVLFSLGLGPTLMRYAVEPSALVVRGLSSGRTIAQAPLGRALRQRFGAPYLVIARADLHTILLDAVRSRTDARLLIGRTALAAQTIGGQAAVTVESAHGQREQLCGPLVIGADGIWSRLRAQITPALPRFQGYHAWRATIAADALPQALLANETSLWLGSGCHLVHYPVSAGRSINVVAVQRAREALTDWTSASGDPRQLDRALVNAAAPVRALIAAASDWRVSALHDLAPSPRWHSGRMVLLGDAAHPVLPFLAQGGALAIEDAAVLVQVLGAGALASEQTLDSALQRFTRMRRDRAVRIQNAARSNGRVYHLPAPLSLARNIALGRIGDGLIDRYRWVYDWKPQTEAERQVRSALA